MRFLCHLVLSFRNSGHWSYIIFGLCKLIIKLEAFDASDDAVGLELKVGEGALELGRIGVDGFGVDLSVGPPVQQPVLLMLQLREPTMEELSKSVLSHLGTTPISDCLDCGQMEAV